VQYVTRCEERRKFVSKPLLDFDNFVWLDVAHDFRRNVWLSKHANLVLRNDLHPMKKSIYIYIYRERERERERENSKEK